MTKAADKWNYRQNKVLEIAESSDFFWLPFAEINIETHDTCLISDYETRRTSRV